MALDPPVRERGRPQDLPQGELALAQFLAIKDPAAFARYRRTSLRAVKAQGGRRSHDLHIDQVLAGGQMPFQAITVDRFPSKESLLTAFDALAPVRPDALSDLYALVVRPADRLPRLVKALGFLGPILSRILGTGAEKEMPGFGDQANPEKGPVPETVAVMRKHDQTTPFFMMNLNRTYPKARYESGELVSGERAYNRYGSRILPYLISVGGYPDIIGQVLATLAGDEAGSLHDDWSEFALVTYPSRRNFIRMMSNAPKVGVFHRDAGLKRAVLMPSSEWRGSSDISTNQP